MGIICRVTGLLGLWVYDDASLSRYAGELSFLREGSSSALLSGGASAFLASTFRKLFPPAGIIAVDENPSRLQAAKPGSRVRYLFNLLELSAEEGLVWQERTQVFQALSS